MRDVTERPETLECGSNILSGSDPDLIVQCARTVLHQTHDWRIPPEYLADNVSDTVIRILTGYRHAG